MKKEIDTADRPSQQPKCSAAELVTFAAASFILAAIVGLVGYVWLHESDKPPVISVSKEQTIREVDGKYYVFFEIINKGGQTAQSVQIIAQLKTTEKVEETGDLQIDFLSSGEKEEGAFVFNQDPRQGQLTIRVSSYQLP
jgi:uncharacterized protein (TIGR02588 family)